VFLRLPHVLLLVAVATIAGCGSVPESEETIAPPPPVGRQGSPKMEFETRTDTVALEKAKLDSAARRSLEMGIRYMVQVGAFKDPHYASLVQTAARDRYHMPALNDYNSGLALYQIRIGFFETREDANAFKARMQKEYPHDYKDAWVVQLKR
jgi:hypothetical protein